MQPSLQTLYSYWNEVRAGRLAPQRLEIEPSRIAGVLAETFMLERVDAPQIDWLGSTIEPMLARPAVTDAADPKHSWISHLFDYVIVILVCFC